MYDLHMGDKTTQEYFQELEKQARLAGLCSDKGLQGHMVEALRQGVLHSYSTSIANLGILIPVGYIIMNEEVINNNWKSDKETNHTGASKQSSGVTTSTGDKKTTTGMTYEGQGKPMDIDMLCAEEKCFQCQKKGH
ncbi:uncharacterized protein ARMOST_06991 [Armillaria ostoyae]|uniref:Retrotransposon gag domain-containing protein n=1 Tax=Armillaria ostoyae TaxID=47428 RepID=A0A284R4I8_ARMOS|nr:uncharacterized protein ARMOST_06991 [Armillaria ostoyae]